MPEAFKTDSQKLGEWEERLRQLVGEGDLLLGELGFDQRGLDEIGSLLASRFSYHMHKQRRSIDNTLHYIKRWPLTFSLYLVLEGIYHYDRADQYWHGPIKRLGIKGTYTTQLGRLFLETLISHNLPTFEQSGGYTYVTPILLHGGIPNEFLSPFFDFLQNREVDPHQITVDSQSLLLLWRREEEAYLSGLARPIYRFLKDGGLVAEDFVDRCLDLFDADSFQEANLPDRVVQAFEQWRAEKGIQTRLIAPRVRLHKPILTLAPFTTGIVLYLPAQQFPSRAAPHRLVWHINLNGSRYQTIACHSQRIEGGYQFVTEQQITVPPAAQYSIDLEADDNHLRTWELSGFADEPPMLVFAPFDDYEGDALIGSEKFQPGERWLIYPQTYKWQETGDSHKVRDLPRLSGQWHEYKLEVWRLVSGNMVLQNESGIDHAVTIIHERVRQRPHLIGGHPLPIPKAASDFPLYIGRPPQLKIYTHQPHRWRIILRSAGMAQPERHQSFKLSELPHDSITDGISLDLALSDLLGETPVGKFELVLRGPLGQTYHFGLRLIPSFEFEGLDQLHLQNANETAHFLFSCDIDTEIRQNPPQDGVNLHSPESNNGQRLYHIKAAPSIKQLNLQLRHNSGVIIPLTIPIHRLRWGLHDGQEVAEVSWQTTPASIFPGAITHGELWVDIPVLKDCPLYVGWQLIDTTGEILQEVVPSEQPIQRRLQWSLGTVMDVWRERQETLCWQLVVQIDDSDQLLSIPAFYLVPQPDFGRLLYEWDENGERIILTLLLERSQPGSYQLQLWSLDRSWIQEPIQLRLDGAHDLTSWQLSHNELPAEAYLAELVAYNPWQSALSKRPNHENPNTLLIKPPALHQHYSEIVRLRDQGQASIEELLALLAHQFYNDQLDDLYQTNKAIADQREDLSLIWLIRWLELASETDRTVYRLAQLKAFDQVMLEKLERQSKTDSELDRYFQHFPKHLPENLVNKLYVWVVQSDLRRLRQRCLESLGKLSADTPEHMENLKIAFAAILNDVRDGALLVEDAVNLLINNVDMAVEFLLQSGDQDAAELLCELAIKVGLEPDWIIIGMTVDSDLGKIEVARLRHRQTAALRFCAPLRSDYYAEGNLLIASGELSVRLDLYNRLLRFDKAQPYLCQHCQGLLGHSIDYVQHHEVKHPDRPQARRRLKKDFALTRLQPRLMPSTAKREVQE